MIDIDPKDYTPPRHQVLLASKGPGSKSTSRVWRNRGEVFMMRPDGVVSTVTSIAGWLESFGLLVEGGPRATGGIHLVPTQRGRDQLEKELRKEGA